MSDPLKDRVEQFNCLELPGQPMGMHMGTSYLVNDLWRELEKAQTERDTAIGEKDEAYRQRNHLVAAIARIFPSGIIKTDIPGWLPEWHNCCYIDLPAGQISYHYHDSHASLFVGLPPYLGIWDGHDKETVHARLAASRLNAKEIA